MKWILNFLSGGLIDRVLDTVDRKLTNEVDKERLKADLLREHLKTRGDYMKAGGFWLMVMFAVPLAVWYAMVIYDSAFGCPTCVWPNTWSVAALPPPLNEWAGLIVMSIFGVVGLTRLSR